MNHRQRIERLRKKLQQNQIDHYALVSWEGSGYASLRYLTGFTGTFGILLVTPKSVEFYTDSRYVHRAKTTLQGLKVERIQQLNSFPELICEFGIDNLSLNAATLSAQQYFDFEAKLDGVTLLPAPDFAYQLRETKEADEIAHIRSAQDVTDKTFTHVLEVLKPGMTEAEVAWEMECFMRTQGSDGLAFPIMVASGPHSALPHHETGNRKLNTGEFVLFDFGAKSSGYCADMTRTVFLGKPSDKHRSVYDTVLRAQQAALEAIEAGVDGKRVDAAARQVIAQAGHGERFGHGTGHGLGLEVHEDPRLSPLKSQTLAKGAVVTVEPGVYEENWGGVRIEDLVVVEDGGCQNLTRSAKGLICL